MRHLSFTIAKLAPAMWEKIKTGEKTLEIRDQPLEADTYVLLVKPDNPTIILGCIKITGLMVLNTWSTTSEFESIVCQIAQCDTSDFNMFFKGKDTLYAHSFEIIPLSAMQITGLGAVISAFNTPQQ